MVHHISVKPEKGKKAKGPPETAEEKALREETERIKAEEDRLKLVEQGNAQRSANIQTCIRDFRASNPVGPTIDAAARFSIFSVSTLRAPDDVVLADLNSWLMMGGRGDPQQAYDAAVTKGCEQANPAGKIDRTKLEKLQSVAEFLK